MESYRKRYRLIISLNWEIMKKRILIIAIYLLAHQVAVADIFEWVDDGAIPWPDQPRGRNQSSTLCPDGAGVDAVSNAVLAGLDLTKAYMRNVDLINADCSGANFYNADFLDADLSGTTFSNANLRGAYFWNTKTSNTLFEGVTSFDNATFHNTDLMDMDLRSSSFTAVHIENSTWTNLNVSGCSFINADITDSTFEGTEFAGCNLTGVHISGNYSKWRNTSFENTILSDGYIDFISVEYTDTYNSFDGVSFSNATINGTALSGHYGINGDLVFFDRYEQGATVWHKKL